MLMLMLMEGAFFFLFGASDWVFFVTGVFFPTVFLLGKEAEMISMRLAAVAHTPEPAGFVSV